MRKSVERGKGFHIEKEKKRNSTIAREESERQDA